jgi:tight adherence protein B
MEISAEKYIMLSIAIIFVAIFILNIILGKNIVLSGLVGGALGLGLPHFVTGFKIKKRQKKFLLLFPDAIDLIVRGIRAGLPVSQSIQSVAAEISEPVGAVFSEMADKIALGVTLDKALNASAKKLGLTEFNFFMTSIILQRETGGNLGEILNNLSDVLRQRQMMRMKIKAMSSEAKASAMIVGSLPFVVFAVLSISSPDYLDPLYNDSRGNMAMFIALGMLGTGVGVMAKMTRFEI